MFVVLGASGHTGAVVANTLLDRGQQVRVIGRNVEHLISLTKRGAEPVAADVTNPTALNNAFKGGEAAYVLIPPNVSTNDVRGFQERVSDAIAAAVRGAGIKSVVALSSIGADKTAGTGPVIGLHNFEQKLNAIDGVNVLNLRAAYFMENTLPQVNAIRMIGSVATPLTPTLKLAMIATHDIGNAAADALLRREFRGKQTRELLGQRDLDYTEVARIIGNAIGKPGLAYLQAPEDQFRPALQQMGMSASMVDLLLEMIDALNSGHMKALEARSPENTTATSFERFVQEKFVPAYLEQMAA